MFRPDPPQGFTSGQGQVIIGRPPIPLFGAPQGIGGEVVPEDPLLAIYPQLSDTDYSRFKFYQVNRGEFTEPQTDFIWEITDTVGPGVFQEASGFDIRAFAETERSLTNAIVTSNSFDPSLTINVIQLSDDELHLFAWEFSTGIIHEWVLSAPHVFPATGTPSDFQFTNSETNGRDIKFILNGTKMAIVGVVNGTIEIYRLPVPFSLSLTPILEQTFDVSFIGGSPAACEFSSDGMELYVIDGNGDDINQWNLLSSFTLPLPATAPDRVFPYDPPITVSIGNVRILKDGLSMYMMSVTPGDQINKYILTDGINQIPIVNKAPDETFDVSSLDSNPRAISLSKDQTLIWFSGRGNNILHELRLPGMLLEYEVTSVNVSTGEFTIKVKVPTIQDLTVIQITIGNASAVDASTILGAGTTLSTFETPLLTKDEDNFLVDDLGRNIMAVQ